MFGKGWEELTPMNTFTLPYLVDGNLKNIFSMAEAELSVSGPDVTQFVDRRHSWSFWKPKSVVQRTIKKGQSSTKKLKSQITTSSEKIECREVKGQKNKADQIKDFVRAFGHSFMK